MKRISIIVAAFAFAVPALAQQPVQSAPDETGQTLASDWATLATTNKHVLDGLNKLVAEKQALKADNDKLKKELEEATAKLAPPAADKK